MKISHQLAIKNLNLKINHHHARGKWFIHDPKHRKENQLQSLGHPFILSIVYKSHIEDLSSVAVIAALYVISW